MADKVGDQASKQRYLKWTSDLCNPTQTVMTAESAVRLRFIDDYPPLLWRIVQRPGRGRLAKNWRTMHDNPLIELSQTKLGMRWGEHNFVDLDDAIEKATEAENGLLQLQSQEDQAVTGSLELAAEQAAGRQLARALREIATLADQIASDEAGRKKAIQISQIADTAVAAATHLLCSQQSSLPPLDGKFAIAAVRRLDGEIIFPDQCVLFLAKDNAFLPTLEYYRRECERIGAGQEQLEAVERLIQRVEQWRKDHPELLKVPDTEPGECP